MAADTYAACLCGRRLPDAGRIARTRAILPRLEYARGLLVDACAGLSIELRPLSRRNRLLDGAAGRARATAGRTALPDSPAAAPAAPAAPPLLPPPPPRHASLRDESVVRLAALALAEAHSMLGRAGLLDDAAPAAAIPIIRHVSSALHAAFPEQSALLCEASSILGGALVDLAAVTGATFDFGRSNAVSSGILAQAKLTAESKLVELYPNVVPARP